MRVPITILFLCSKYWYVYGDDDGDGDGDFQAGNAVEDSIHDLRGSTERFKIEDDFLVRAPKFLTFNKDSNKLRVEASFAVPLLSIPVGGETTNVNGGNAAVTVPKVDINVKSVVTVASIFLLVFVILPKLSRIYSPPGDQHDFRSSGDTMLSDAVKLLSETLERRYNIDLESCTQKAICWTMNKVVKRIKEGKANGPEKLVDAISSMPYLEYMFGDTWPWSFVQQMISFRNNHENGNCEQFDQKCFITSKGISLAAGTLLASL